MLVSFRSCGPKDHGALLKLVIAYNQFEKNPVHRKRLSQGLDVLLRNPSQGKMWLMENHKKPVAIFYRKGGLRELPRRVMMLEVRPEEVVQARRISASKRR